MTTSELLLHKTYQYIGVQEDPPDSNINPFGEWYGMNGVPWCAIFISFCLYEAGLPLPIQTEKGFHYCPAAVSYFRRKKQWYFSPEPGDIAFFCWDFSGIARHVGIVEGVEGGKVVTIEGNTSPTSDCNGGTVMRRFREPDEFLGFAAPLTVAGERYSCLPYPSTRVVETEGPSIELFLRQLMRRGWSVDTPRQGTLTIEKELVARFQAEAGLPSTGEIDNRTWEAAWAPLT